MTSDSLLVSNIIRKYLVETKGAATDPISGTGEIMAKTVWEQGYPALRNIFGDMVQLQPGIISHVVPVPALGTILTAEPAAGDVTFIAMSYKTVTADQVRGVNYGWCRAYLENCAWDALAPQLKEAGRLVEQAVFDVLYAHLVTDCDSGNKVTWTKDAAMTYADFLKGPAFLAGDDLGEGMVAILNPTEYFELLNDQKFIDASYIGDSDPIRTGVIRTTLGVDVFRSTRATAGTAVFVNVPKAICVAVIRDRKVEEYAYPDQDLYGFVATMKFGSEVILPKAVAIVSEATS